MYGEELLCDLLDEDTRVAYQDETLVRWSEFHRGVQPENDKRHKLRLGQYFSRQVPSHEGTLCKPHAASAALPSGLCGTGVWLNDRPDENVENRLARLRVPIS